MIQFLDPLLCSLVPYIHCNLSKPAYFDVVVVIRTDGRMDGCNIFICFTYEVSQAEKIFQEDFLFPVFFLSFSVLGETEGLEFFPPFEKKSK